MYVTVHVTAGELRGMPFGKYSHVLHNLIGEKFQPDDIDIRFSEKTEVTIVPAEFEAAKEIRQMAREMTHETVKDGYFA